MKQKIAITSITSLSPLGNSFEGIWQSYLLPKTLISKKKIKEKEEFVTTIPRELRINIDVLRQSDNKYKSLDETVLMAILVSRQAVKNAGWKEGEDFGINIGSSRGATQLFEQYHQEYLETGVASTLTSPVTTLGNISTWVAHDLKSTGVEISHSITCSTALHAILNAVAWLQSGLATKFLVGGSEAPLTDFTIAQMKALKIYANQEQDYPCRAFDLGKNKNTMVLGEAASVACLELGEKENALAYVSGIGYAMDTLKHNISISEDAECFQKSMKMAIGDLDVSKIDAIVMHAPGTIKGDLSEYKAIQKVFGNNLPLLTTNKWKIGHTFGASGMLSVELAVMMLQYNQFIGVPFVELQVKKKTIERILVNAVGFGGNAVSILVSKE